MYGRRIRLYTSRVHAWDKSSGRTASAPRDGIHPTHSGGMPAAGRNAGWLLCAVASAVLSTLLFSDGERAGRRRGSQVRVACRCLGGARRTGCGGGEDIRLSLRASSGSLTCGAFGSGGEAPPNDGGGAHAERGRQVRRHPIQICSPDGR